MQIDWSKAPDWAQFVAQDADGSWHWYQDAPDNAFFGDQWAVDTGRYQRIPRTPSPTWKDTLQRRPEPELIGTNIPLSWADSEDDKPESRADLRRVLTEWNDVTGALPRDSGWMCEVLGMMEDAYDLGAHQAAKESTK